jgi:enolase
MSFTVADLTALEILDSRARPTLAVTVRLADGTIARAGVPSGASTGSREAVELRDGDKSRFGGSGVLKAVANVNGELADLLRGRAWDSLVEADEAMISLDERGFAPEIREPEEVPRLLVKAVGDAGYPTDAGGVSIGLDLAASEFRQPDGRYLVAGDLLSSADMIDRLAAITRDFPVHLIEDGLGEDDDEGCRQRNQRVRSRHSRSRRPRYL